MRLQLDAAVAAFDETHRVAVLLERAVDEIHRRRAENAGHEQVRRRIVELRGVSICCTTPLFRTTMRSPNVIASS